MSSQTTIRSPVRFSHRGILNGRVASIRLRPGPVNSGIVFNDSIPACVRYAFVEDHFVNLSDGTTTIMAVEHLLAACYGLGIDNLQVEVTGGEVPFGDGSALPFIRILHAAGLKVGQVARKIQSLNRPIVVHQEDAFVCALPAPPAPHAACGASAELQINYFICFPEAELGEQFFGCQPTAANFAETLGCARTFGYRQNGQRLPAWLGRVRRAAPVVRKEGTPLGGMSPLSGVPDDLILPARPRFADEPVRHKALDLLGDLCLLGRRLNALIFAYKAGHRLHHKLVRELEDQWT
jgi:UDP-3-O-[3-hydroxymyristoyl] N-acetylglucosamine deacetylase